MICFSSFSNVNPLARSLAQVRNSVYGCHFFFSLIKQDRDVSIALFPEDSIDSAFENQLEVMETRDRKLCNMLAIKVRIIQIKAMVMEKERLALKTIL